MEEESIPISSFPSPLPTMNDNINNDNDDAAATNYKWTAATAFQVIALFIAAGFAEIGGGWLVWQTIKEKKPYWWAILGSMILILYGFIPTWQPAENFGRVYAAYGGFYIVMSFLAGWALDGYRPDKGDIIGGVISLGGACLVFFWPRAKE